jgi:hypothetical protein
MTTFATSAAIGQKESLADIIYRIDPSETPAFSNLKKSTSSAVFVEWQTQDLASASATNYVNEGADASTAAATLAHLMQWTQQVGNVNTIIKKC